MMLVDSNTGHWPIVLKRIFLHNFSFKHNNRKINFFSLFAGYFDFSSQVDIVTDSNSFLIPRIIHKDLANSPDKAEVGPDQLIKNELRLIVSSKYEQLESLINEDQFDSNTNRIVAKRRLQILYEIRAQKAHEGSND